MDYGEFRKMKMAELKKKYPKRSDIENREEVIAEWKKYKQANESTEEKPEAKKSSKPNNTFAPKVGLKSKAMAKKAMTDSESSSSSESDTDVPPSKGKATMVKSAYQQFVSNAMSKIRDAYPGKSNKEYMRKAAFGWKKHKENGTSLDDYIKTITWGKKAETDSDYSSDENTPKPPVKSSPVKKEIVSEEEEVEEEADDDSVSMKKTAPKTNAEKSFECSCDDEDEDSSDE
jgi:hypothetical protein